MKKIKILVASLLIGSVAYAQLPPLGNSGISTDWKRGGNNLGGGNPPDANIFGTFYNSPIYTYTNSVPRMIVNGTKTPALFPLGINGHAFDRSGFVGIGGNGGDFYNIANPNTNRGPYSLLHLHGTETPWLDQLGHHDWMRTGITFTDNHDLAYLGMRTVDNTENLTEFTLTWSNNPTQFGPDDMVFRFSNNSGSQTVNTTNLLDNTDGDALHIARFTGTGLFGMGPTFGVGNSVYVTPQSLIHLSYVNRESVYTQYTNRDVAVGSGTGETASDGLRVGILGANNNQRNGNALVYQQENRHLLFSTRANTQNVTTNNTLERMRITRIGAPTNLPSNGYGQYNPANLDNNFTRVSISHDPQNPVTRPLSLLHLGYNSGAFSLTPGATDGWRDWMDIGMFTSNGTDNVYIGLKDENGQIGNDRQDAVINWGDNDDTNPLTGPDNLRFIFTSTQTGTGNSPANTNNGLETVRVTPEAASTLGTNFGMVGIGDWTTAFNTTAGNEIDAKLDIDGDLRIREVTEDTTLLQVLVIDSTDHNRVHWRSIEDFGGGVGNYCSEPQIPLTGSYEIPLNDFNYYFTGSGLPNTNSVSVGVPCSTFLPAKFVSYQNAQTSVSTLTIAGGFRNEDVANISSLTHYGVYGEAIGDQTVGEITNVGGHFIAENASWRNIGVRGVARSGTHPSSQNFAGFFNATATNDWINYGIQTIADNADVNYGIFADAPIGGFNRAGFFNGDVETINPVITPSDQMFKNDIENIKEATEILRKLRPHTYKMNTSDYPQFNFSEKKQYGFIVQEIAEVLPDLVHESYMPSEYDSLGNEIYSELNYKSLNYNALIPITVQAVNEITEKLEKATLSDQNVKTNVQDLSNSLDKIKQMRGVTYEWSSTAQTNLNLDSLQHIGFIAQEIESIEPLLTFVDDSNLVHVNYDRVVPILVESIKELDAIVQTKDSAIANLQTQIIEIRNCLNNANICYGEENRTSYQNPSNDVNERSIQLVNNSSIILDQNLPNPFAENTVITYTIPDDVMEAKLMFYNMNGRIIKEMEIEERGESKLTVYGENLESGIYTYSLIADGKLIATKKMVKQ